MSDKDAEKSENLRRVFEQYWLHGRHLENERLWSTNIYAILWAGSLAFMSQQGASIGLVTFLLILSYLGMLICHSLRLPFIRHTRMAEIILRKEWQLKQYSVFYRREDFQKTYQSGEVNKPISMHLVFYCVYTVGIVASSIIMVQQIPWLWVRILFGVLVFVVTVFVWCWFLKVEDRQYKEIGSLDGEKKQ